MSEQMKMDAERAAFEREDRYLVIKYSDLNKVSAEYRLPFMEYLDDVNSEIPRREFVVVESDWPEYETVWRMIEARMTGAHLQGGVLLPASPYMPECDPGSMTDYERGEAQGRCDMWEEVRRLNSASQPVGVSDGVEEVEVVGWLQTDATRKTPMWLSRHRQVSERDIEEGALAEPLMTVSQHRRIVAALSNRARHQHQGDLPARGASP